MRTEPRWAGGVDLLRFWIRFRVKEKNSPEAKKLEMPDELEAFARRFARGHEE